MHTAVLMLAPLPVPFPAFLHRCVALMQDRSQLMYLQRFRATSATLLRVEAGALTLRAAFSHVPFWRAATNAVYRVVLAPAPAAGSRVTSPAYAAAHAAASLDGLEELGCPGANAVAAAEASRRQPFRPSSLQITMGVQQATAVLCNDKPETCGAPDVLQCSMAGVSLAYDMATLLPDRPANKAGT